jgi:transposase
LVGLDLHYDNVCGIIADPNDRWVLKRKFPTCLKTILSALEPYKEKIGGVVVEATATWYWLVDGLMEAGYKVHLANPAALDGSKGKKRTNDFDDAIGLTIAFEAGTLSRFPSTGDYLSYCRCVDSKRITNGKKKGENNRKNGNAYLCWAYVEAANFAKRYCPYARAYFNHKLKQTGMYVIAIKALASKIARATFYMMTKEADYDPKKVFGSYKAAAQALIEKQKP